MFCYDNEARLLFASERTELLANEMRPASTRARAERGGLVSPRADRARRRRQDRPEAEARLRRKGAAEAARS